MAPGELPHAPGETWTVGSAPAVAGSPGPSGLVVTFPCESKQLSAAWAGLPSQLSVLGSTDPNRSARQMTLFHPDLQRAGNTLEDLVYGLNKCTSPVKDGSAGLVTDRKSYATSGWAFLPKRSSGDPHPVQLYFARSGTTVTVLRILGGPVPRTAEEYRKVRDTLVERTRVYAEQGTKIYDGSQIDTRAFMKPDELAHYGTEKWTLQSGPRVDFANRPRAESASLLPCGAKELRLAIGRQVQIYDTADRASDAAEARSQFQYVLFTSGHDEAATLYRTFADALSKCGRQALGPSVAAVKRTAVGKSGSAWSYATSSPGDYNFRDVHVFIAPAGSTVSILILQTLEAGESYATGQDPAVLKALEAHACVYDDDGC
jgi:hypothetical protein